MYVFRVHKSAPKFKSTCDPWWKSYPQLPLSQKMKQSMYSNIFVTDDIDSKQFLNAWKTPSHAMKLLPLYSNINSKKESQGNPKP